MLLFYCLRFVFSAEEVGKLSGKQTKRDKEERVSNLMQPNIKSRCVDLHISAVSTDRNLIGITFQITFQITSKFSLDSIGKNNILCFFLTADYVRLATCQIHTQDKQGAV